VKCRCDGGLSGGWELRRVHAQRWRSSVTRKDLLRYEITTMDHALIRPWTVLKTFRRVHNVLWSEDQCSEAR
jgi:hypothetical protein